MVARSNGRRARREARAATGEATEDSAISVEVRDAMARLSMRSRSVLYLAYWHDLTVDEIAKHLGLSRRSTERSLTDARRTLEELLS
jgi:RNA polymerase sigma factor (sigma-70 family)